MIELECLTMTCTGNMRPSKSLRVRFSPHQHDHTYQLPLKWSRLKEPSTDLDLLQIARDFSSSRSQVNVTQGPAITSPSVTDPMSSSQSLSSARKRHFQEVDQRDSQHSHDRDDEDVAEENENDGQPNPKRSRPSPRTSDASLREFGSLSSTHRRHRQTASSASDRVRLNSRRSSKFVEGSMRDRVSQCPPDDFTQTESASSRSMSEQRGRASSEAYVSHDAGIEVVRPSGIQRFGKVLASTFDPTSIFLGSDGRVNDKQDPRASQERQRWDDRRVRAEVAYADLKKNNYPGTLRIPTHSSQGSRSRLNLGGQSTEYQALLKRNSYADRMEESVVQDSNRNRPIAYTSEATREIPSPTPDLYLAPTIETVIQEDQMLSPPAPEHPWSSLKRVKSYFRFPGARRRSLSPSKAPLNVTEQAANPPRGSPLRESPSKRDLKKQKKLLSKISNLEDKLEHAKRDLRFTLEDVPPMPKLPAAYPADVVDRMTKKELAPLEPIPAERPSKFVPGLLPSLPSERLFNSEDRAIHEELLRKKARVSEEDSVKAQFRKKPTKAAPKLQDGDSNLENYSHSSLSCSVREPPASVKVRIPSSKFSANAMDGRHTGPGSENEDTGCACCGACVNSTGSMDYLTDIQKGDSTNPRTRYTEKGQQEENASEGGLENQSAMDLNRMNHLTPAQHNHQRSSSRTLSEKMAESLNQIHNQGSHLTRGDRGNRVLALNPQKHHDVPPVPRVPKGMKGVAYDKPSGKENRAKDTRLSGVCEEEEFTWDEDVF